MLASHIALHSARRSSADGVTLVVSKAEIPHLGDVEDARLREPGVDYPVCVCVCKPSKKPKTAGVPVCRSSKGPAGPIPNPDKDRGGLSCQRGSQQESSMVKIRASCDKSCKEASGGETRVHDPEVGRGSCLLLVPTCALDPMAQASQAGHESHAAEEDFDPPARERDSQASLHKTWPVLYTSLKSTVVEVRVPC